MGQGGEAFRHPSRITDDGAAPSRGGRSAPLYRRCDAFCIKFSLSIQRSLKTDPGECASHCVSVTRGTFSQWIFPPLFRLRSIPVASIPDQAPVRRLQPQIARRAPTRTRGQTAPRRRTIPLSLIKQAPLRPLHLRAPAGRTPLDRLLTCAFKLDSCWTALKHRPSLAECRVSRCGRPATVASKSK
jgi:hypothetical protein